MVWMLNRGFGLFIVSQYLCIVGSVLSSSNLKMVAFRCIHLPTSAMVISVDDDVADRFVAFTS